MHDDSSHLTTEARNPASLHLDRLSTQELVRLMNLEDARVIPAIASQTEVIAKAIDLIAERLKAGGRLIYIGAGTSGRLGVLDAAECPPTFRTPPELVVGLIAGGPPALTRAVEGAEDDPAQAVRDLAAIGFCAKDVLICIATSGRTPYVLGAAEHARSLGVSTIGITCNHDATLNKKVNLAIVPVVGPEVLSGSTRLKAGTATKLVLNMLSTGAMVRLGKTYGNLMVDLRATNTKLVARARRIVSELTGVDSQEASALLDRCQREVKTALVSQLTGVSAGDARLLLQKSEGRVERALQQAGISSSKPVDRSLILGIDGGGTSTTAFLAQVTGKEYKIIGRGEAGPSNRQSVGDVTTTSNLQLAIQRAFQNAQRPFATLGAACLGLAGADRPDDQAFLLDWADSIALADKTRITNDAELVLAAGTPEGWGIAIIAGTGSIAYGKNQQGQTARAGGWGHLLGDKGSAYSIAVDALQSAVIEIDTGLNLDSEPLTESNALLPLIMKHWQLSEPSELVHKVYRSGLDRSGIAELAPIILSAFRQGNADTKEVVEINAIHLAGDAAILMRKLFAETLEVPIAMAGGLFTNFPAYADLVLDELRRCRTTATLTEPLGRITFVPEPRQGALRLAHELLPSVTN